MNFADEIKEQNYKNKSQVLSRGILILHVTESNLQKKFGGYLEFHKCFFKIISD